MAYEKELDMSYDGKSARVFGRIWGQMRDMGMGDKITNAKPTIRKELDRLFKPEPDDFEKAENDFIDTVLDYLEAVGATQVQRDIMEIACEDTLRFNFFDGRGNV